MKQNIAVEEFLAGRRVVIAKFVAHRHREVQNKAKKVVGVVNLYEVQCADGKAGGVAIAEISKEDGCIIRVSHSK
jgi:hypothetical protein